MPEPGDLIVVPYQYEFRGFLFGSQTSWRTESVTHLNLPQVRTEGDSDLPGEHGTMPGEATYGSQIIDIEMFFLGLAGEDIEEKAGRLRRAFQLPKIRRSRILDQFVWQRPGEPKKFMWARCHKREIPSDYDLAVGLGHCQVQLMAYDPLTYSLNLETTSLSLAGGVNGGQVDINNQGDCEEGATPVIRITGPWNNPRIQNTADDGRTIRIDVVLGAADELEIDVSRFTVKKNGANTFASVRNDNQWWRVVPGVNTIVASRDAGAGATGTMEIDWRHTWV